MTSLAHLATAWPPLPAAPVTARRRGGASRLSAWSDWVTVAPATPRPRADLQLKAQYVLKATGLSRRQLAELLTITHPTLSALVDGRSTDLARSPEAQSRLRDLHAVVRRLAVLVPEPTRLASVLTNRDATGTSALALFAAGQVTAAYAHALREVTPPSPGPVSSVFPKVSGSATSPLHD